MTIRVISGGQTGADRGGLDGALDLGIQIGGWCPKGRKAEDGIIPQKYTLKESNSSGYINRTIKNAEFADATVVFLDDNLSPGSARTLEICVGSSKPVLIVNKSNASQERDSGMLTAMWLNEVTKGLDHPVINVAGSRESKAPGLQEFTRDYFKAALRKLLIFRKAESAVPL